MSEQLFVLQRRSLIEKNDKTLASLPETDAFGRVIFRAAPEPIDSELVQSSLKRVVAIIQSAVSASGVSISSVKLKLAVDSKVGLILIGDAGIEASIEIELDFKH